MLSTINVNKGCQAIKSTCFDAMIANIPKLTNGGQNNIISPKDFDPCLRA